MTDSSTIEPFTAAFLTFLIPGWGQYRRGKKLQALIWLVVVVAGYFLMLVPGVILHVICIAEAYWRK